ncbi:MAG TPA: glycosyltransferase family 1 protein [Terriglobales bacterium]|nr:glycosyltransferase family 1 protein [Terriglobales bacterium]
MKVAIDIRRMTEFGVGTYIRNVVRTLAQLDGDSEYFLIGSPHKVAECGALPPNFHTVELAGGDDTLQGNLDFRAIVKRLECDVVHIPHLFWIPRGLSCPYVLTVHDLLEHMYGSRNASSLRRSLHFYLTRRVLRKAARVIAVSQFTKNEIHKLLEIEDDRIEVVYNAIDERFLRGHATEADRDLIAQRYLVNYPFILYAGAIRPHKNVVRIIEAFSALKSELQKEDEYPDLKLIIIGDDLSSHPRLRRTVVRSAVQNDVRFLGFVPIEVLRIFYDVAKVFVFPSLYEGFGLPPLEAMAHGTPVVTANTSSLPEVAGNAALLVNPENVFEIRRGLHRALLDPVLRARMKQRGYEQAQRFSWTTSVSRILEIYREVAEHRISRVAAAD